MDSLIHSISIYTRSSAFLPSIRPPIHPMSINTWNYYSISSIHLSTHPSNEHQHMKLLSACLFSHSFIHYQHTKFNIFSSIHLLTYPFFKHQPCEGDKLHCEMLVSTTLHSPVHQEHPTQPWLPISSPARRRLSLVTPITCRSKGALHHGSATEHTKTNPESCGWLAFTLGNRSLTKDVSVWLTTSYSWNVE